MSGMAISPSVHFFMSRFFMTCNAQRNTCILKRKTLRAGHVCKSRDDQIADGVDVGCVGFGVGSDGLCVGGVGVMAVF
jgi:hypothetical protein